MSGLILVRGTDFGEEDRCCNACADPDDRIGEACQL
jgi:hypothetical protein